MPKPPVPNSARQRVRIKRWMGRRGASIYDIAPQLLTWRRPRRRDFETKVSLFPLCQDITTARATKCHQKKTSVRFKTHAEHASGERGSSRATAASAPIKKKSIAPRVPRRRDKRPEREKKAHVAQQAGSRRPSPKGSSAAARPHCSTLFFFPFFT